MVEMVGRWGGGEMVEDLIELQGPCTEAAILACLHRRLVEGKNMTRLGPVLLSVGGEEVELSPEL